MSKLLKDEELTLRMIEEADLPILWEFIFKEENPEWKQWDAPYYKHEMMSYKSFLKQKDQWMKNEQRFAIEVNHELVGVVSYYWEHKLSNWLEMGIVFYRPVDWGKGYGARALKLWMDHLFETLPLVRVGYSTWSGNHRMVRLGEKLGMKMEARIRKVRYWNGDYYDSIRMGILKEEWNQI